MRSKQQIDNAIEMFEKYARTLKNLGQVVPEHIVTVIEVLKERRKENDGKE